MSESSGHKVINELSESKYFGEISCLTNLPATASIHVISHSTWFRLKKEQFSQFLENFNEWKTVVYETMYNYSDFYFKRTLKILKKVSYFHYLPERTKRKMMFYFWQNKYVSQSIIAHYKEWVDKFSFIIQGSINVYFVNERN